MGYIFLLAVSPPYYQARCGTAGPRCGAADQGRLETVVKFLQHHEMCFSFGPQWRSFSSFNYACSGKDGLHIQLMVAWVICLCYALAYLVIVKPSNAPLILSDTAGSQLSGFQNVITSDRTQVSHAMAELNICGR